ncbi:relaxase/mobilization nuclease domain-containing protein [uncultured Gemmiger sp.]|uniref:relaxase/mobilization nuclease domain-containing protein n=1 Tax=uncultured Gemmiger sp. TaxID=1623490 RepID=UPI0025DBAE69|nr:relaxase/mobilization nuclease domain-containing protein [uncultured Gemmiger sp.]
MAATRLIALHINKGKTIAQCLRDRTDYAQNPAKTEKGELVTGYECDPMTADEEFLLAKRQYTHITGRRQQNDVIAYQIRQSFKPGEITPEEANRIGYELGMRFTKGKHAFLVATHTDRSHIHNHIIFNSTALNCRKKFRDFHNSGLALQKVSDILCVEHGLSIIEPKPYRDRVKRTDYPKRPSFRDEIRQAIDRALQAKPKDFEAFLRLLEQEGYTCKRGKHTALRGKGQTRYLRFRSLGEGYSEEEIRAVILGEREHHARSKGKPVIAPKRLNLLVEIDARLQAKGIGYQRWATVYNLKQMAQTMIFLREHGITDVGQLQEKAAQAVKRFDQLDGNIKAAEKRLVEIAALKKHILNYAKTKDVYVEYRKSGYSKKFYESHREAITLHKAAKDAFNGLDVKKLPKVKDLTAEYAAVLSDKKAAYAQYRNARSEMQEYLKAQKNVEQFLHLTRQEAEKTQEEKQKQETQR